MLIILVVIITSCNPSGMSSEEIQKSQSIQKDTTIIYDGVYPPHDDNVTP